MGEELSKDTDQRADTASGKMPGSETALDASPLGDQTAHTSAGIPAESASTPLVAVALDAPPHAGIATEQATEEFQEPEAAPEPPPIALLNTTLDMMPEALPNMAASEQPDAEPDKALVPVAPSTLPAEQSESALPGVRRGQSALAPSATVLLVVAGLVAVAGAAALALALTQGDWGSGARAAGIACLALGVLCLLALGVRTVLGRRRVAWSGIAAIVICGLLGGSALTATNPLRLAQGHRLEATQDWPGALRAYVLAGEEGTASADPARVYVEWGYALARQGQYAAAVDRYEQAISRYPDAQSESQRAISELWPAYDAWLGAPSASLPYLIIIQRLHGYQHSNWCSAACQAAAAALEARSRFAYGQELAAERQYAQAVKYLQSVPATDPTSPYVALAHAAGATAYLALGQSELRGPTCATALPTYQTLATAYKDTPSGKQAIAALAAPVTVAGRLTGYPTNPAPTMYLSTKAFSVSHFSDDYSAALDASGNFSFAQVNPGAYNLSAAFGDGSGRYWQNTTTNNPYTVAVTPLCTLNLGTYAW